MKRYFAALTLVMTTSVSACGGSDAPAPTATEGPKDHIAVAAALGYPKVDVGPDGKGECDYPPREFSVFKEGAQVVLLNSQNETVATTTLEAPEPLEAACGWRAFFDSVPRGGKFYTAQLGSFKSQTIPEADLGEKAFAIQP